MRWPKVIACLLWGLALLVVLPQLLPAQTFGRHIVTDRLQTEPVGADVAQLPHVRLTVGGEVFDLEVAIDNASMQRGLMYRTELADDHGMLFPLVPRRTAAFWMKNTRIPLDMLFIRERQVLNVLHDVPPCQADPCPTYKSVSPVDMVIELSAGTARRLGIDHGTPITLTSAGDEADPMPTADPSAQTPAPDVRNTDAKANPKANSKTSPNL